MIDSASDPDQGYEIRAASSVDRAFVPPNWYNVTAPLISVEALNTKDFSELILRCVHRWSVWKHWIQRISVSLFWLAYCSGWVARLASMSPRD